jgi:hypothetical protein
VTTICLAVPHTPWVPERVESMKRVRAGLELEAYTKRGIDYVLAGEHVALEHYCEFTERASNKIWPRKMWGWMLETGADWCLSIQDDTLIAPCFWAALRAMLRHVGERAILGLAAAHPLGPSIAASGHRWYKTQSWAIGWAYALRRGDLAQFVDFVDKHPEWVAQYNEDELLNRWVQETKRFTWHPCPTIIDHDVSVPSQYNNDDHTHRRSTVTWRDYGEASLSDPDFWLPSGDPQLLPLAWVRTCWHCGEEEGKLRSAKTGAYIGPKCLAEILGFMIARLQ